MTELSINGQQHRLELEPETPLLWAIRDTVGLTGTKVVCGIQQCGTCTVLIGKRSVRSCGITVGEVRSEEHTSELQSRTNLVRRLLREKKTV